MDNNDEHSIPWPDWSIKNALAVLKESRDRHEQMSNQGTDEHLKGINNQTVLTLDFAIEVVKSIKSLTPPQPEPSAVIAHKAVRKFRKAMAEALRNFADDIDDDDWGWPDEH